MPITNDDQLNAIILNDLKGIIDEVAEKVFLKLRESIQQNVYDAGTPTTYNRQLDNGGLLGSFAKQNVSLVGQVAESKIDQDPMSMNNDSDNFIHGSNFWQGGDDVREYLTDWIIKGRPDIGSYFGEGFWRSPRNFWQPMIDMINNGDVDRMIESAFNSRGIIWRK